MSKPWIKLWARWYESTSHALLSPQALHTGPHLLVLASKYGRQEDGSARLLGPHGDPLEVDEIARLTRWPPRQIRKVLRELVKAGTLDESEGIYTFPRFINWQESSSAARVRKHRNTVTATVTVTPEKRPKTEDRRQKTDPPGGPPPKQTRINGTGDEPDEHGIPPSFYRAVTAYLAEAVKRVTGGRDSGPRDCDGNREMIRICTEREGATLDDWKRVIDAQAANVQPNPGKWQYLCLSTLYVRKNFRRCLEAPRTRSAPRGPVDPSTQDHTSENPF